MPDHHPCYRRHHEYFNFGSPTPEIIQHRLSVKYYEILRTYLSENPQHHISVKVLLGQAPLHIIKHLITSADFLYNTVRTDYKAQLKSYVAALKTLTWLEGRRSYNYDSVTQEHVDMCHKLLSDRIKQHSDLYKKYGGEIVVLENRHYSPYPNKPEFSDRLVWPDFCTRNLFDIT